MWLQAVLQLCGGYTSQASGYSVLGVWCHNVPRGRAVCQEWQRAVWSHTGPQHYSVAARSAVLLSCVCVGLCAVAQVLPGNYSTFIIINFHSM